MTPARPEVLVLGSSFAGLTAARFIRARCGDAADLTVIDRNPYLIFVPNISMEVFADHGSARVDAHGDGPVPRSRHEFINAAVNAIDPDHKTVTFVPTYRAGSAPETIRYDYLVIALGNQLAYDRIEEFGEYGDTVSSGYYGNKLRRKLVHGYNGGPIAIGSARFHQGLEGKPEWMPVAEAACEGPPLELALSMAHWLQERSMGDAKKVTLFTPAKIIPEDAGEAIVTEFLDLATKMGFGYKPATEDVTRISADGIEFASGDSVDAEIKIALPDWVPHQFLKELTITDEYGFVITGTDMANAEHSEVFAVGDAAALTVPKLGSLAHQQAEIVARQIAARVGRPDASKAEDRYRPEIVCFGDMGGHKGFYIHSDTWFGGSMSIFKMGYSPWAMKMAFKEMYFRSGGKPLSWGMPASELAMDRLPLP